MMRNFVSFIGNIGADLEIKELEFGAVLNFAICIDESYYDKDNKRVEKSEWFQIFAQGDLAKQIHRNFKKGDQIALIGKLRNRKWINKTTEQEQFITELWVTSVEYKACITRVKEQN